MLTKNRFSVTLEPKSKNKSTHFWKEQHTLIHPIVHRHSSDHVTGIMTLLLISPYVFQFVLPTEERMSVLYYMCQTPLALKVRYTETRPADFPCEDVLLE